MPIPVPWPLTCRILLGIETRPDTATLKVRRLRIYSAVGASVGDGCRGVHSPPANMAETAECH